MDRAATRQSRRLVAIWLFTVAAMIMVMIVLGGVTRLTGSGLSIMEWAPLMGVLPPTSDAEWTRLFELYQKIPQYTLVNDGFGLDGFKHIFWLEWTHRLWGRLIGVVFLLPLLLLLATARIERRVLPRLGLLFVLGGLQGAVGWFMVASGFLPDTTAVSPYRLVIHLVLALILYAAIVWTGLSALYPLRHRVPVSRWLRGLTIASLVMVSVTIVAGGLTAGLHAGLTYNTFPLMDGHLVPADYTMLSPLIRNLTENVAAVQFDHRLLATVNLGCCWRARRNGLARRSSALVDWLPRRNSAWAVCPWGDHFTAGGAGVDRDTSSMWCGDPSDRRFGPDASSVKRSPPDDQDPAGVRDTGIVTDRLTFCGRATRKPVDTDASWPFVRW